MLDGWHAERESRSLNTGPAGGRTSDLYYYSATGVRFRSRREVARSFALDENLALAAQKKEREERLAAKQARRASCHAHAMRPARLHHADTL